MIETGAIYGLPRGSSRTEYRESIAVYHVADLSESKPEAVLEVSGQGPELPTRGAHTQLIVLSTREGQGRGAIARQGGVGRDQSFVNHDPDNFAVASCSW